MKVVLKDLRKTYEGGKVVAVDDVSLEIRDGEFFSFLGPSGCGKTTTLRLIAGFEYPDKGSIFIGDEEVTFKKPYERNTAMVFQNYALWPHMTVYENIAYGLKIRKVREEEQRKRIREVLELVKLTGLENRYPTQLSGGQQQRVALARALVVQPKVLLLDEPLSNLDAKVRIEVREEIKRIQRELKITTIYVTHDQEEAMSISDRIAVMNQGRIAQIGTPEELYFSPRELFVASFFGKPNILDGIYLGEGKAEIQGGVEMGITPAAGQKELERGDKLKIVIRPEHIYIRGRGAAAPDKIWKLSGRVVMRMFTGDSQEVKVAVGKDREVLIYASAPSDLPISIGEEVELEIPVSRVLAFRA
ncbi:MAG TPA: ABC transporter ATP-binding protein [Fervidicoccus fontis]|uniref:Molybdate/tungstate import ATP-binding protein WtpC n=1 Tax=Fervidicoccus fontis TaxID=683846 RepID=A0A7C2UIR6_9CREN|nr:ABC transporter ATP-binding protein [Fervidicoccus fontis]